jgi:hypothetical protein
MIVTKFQQFPLATKLLAPLFNKNTEFFIIVIIITILFFIFIIFPNPFVTFYSSSFIAMS